MSACAAGYGDHLDADLALAFADDMLAPGERVEVERRIDACAICRGAIAAAARETAGPTKREKPLGAQRPRSGQLVAGDVVGRYVVERPLGAGGMGVVSLARDPELRRAVVIKLVRPDAFDDDLEARLRREAQAMAQLSHPNVVQIFDIGRHGDRVFLAMEFIAGQTLDAWLIERERSIDEIIAMFLQAGRGLEAAHRGGLLHRDFKPTNVLVDRNGIAKVTDFGLARALGARESAAMAIPRTSGVHAILTHANERIGTPAYMAPEQIAGRPLDARTDQFALALALLDALLGQQPARRRVMASQPPAELDAALAKVPRRAAIIRALSQDPAGRWPDLATFLRELSPPRRERRWWPVIALAAIAVAGITTYLAVRPEPAAAGCVATAPRAWASTRPGIEAKLAVRPRAFASWHAAHLLAAVDQAAADIGALEVSYCETEPSAADAGCLAKRRAALSAAALLDDDPAAAIHAIASCAPAPPTNQASRAELATADAERARAIADQAGTDDQLRADALERAAGLERARGYLAEAANDYLGVAAAGERTGDDALRGRALLGLLEVARMRGDLPDAQIHVRQLDSMLAKHGNAAADVVTVANAAATAWIDLGDARAATAAVERAVAAAKSPDDRLRTATTRARLLAEARAHPEAAAAVLAEAIAENPDASAGVRDAAWTATADLVLDQRDAKAAQIALAAVATPEPLRAAHARILAGAPLDELDRVTGDATMLLRRDLLHARLQHEAGNDAKALEELTALAKRASDATSSYAKEKRLGLSAMEIGAAHLLFCEVQVANRAYEAADCSKPMTMFKMHASHPAFVRYLLARAAIYGARDSIIEASPLADAIAILELADAKPLVIAEIQLRLARVETSRSARTKAALAARPVFLNAARMREVAELDAIIAANR